MPNPTPGETADADALAAWLARGTMAPPWTYQQGWWCFHCMHMHKETTTSCPQD